MNKDTVFMYEQRRIQTFHINIHGLFICVDVSDHFIIFHYKTMEVMIFDSDVLSTKFYLHIN